jgi:protein involved in polysaccharide export with SLBB domain
VQGLSWLELEQRARKNRIYLDLNQVNQLKSTYIMDRDSLIVPREMGTVYVYGQVEKPGFVNHQPGASLNYYLNSAGGYALASDPKRVYVIKAGTLAWSEANDTKIESGDMVYVDRIMLDDNLQRRSFMRQSQSLYTTIVLSVISTTLTVINFFRN